MLLGRSMQSEVVYAVRSDQISHHRHPLIHAEIRRCFSRASGKRIEHVGAWVEESS
jgi:hypothetical protein